MGFIISCLVILALIAVIWGQKTAQKVFSVITSIIAILSLLIIVLIFLSTHPGFLSDAIQAIIKPLIGLIIVFGFAWWRANK